MSEPKVYNKWYCPLCGCIYEYDNYARDVVEERPFPCPTENCSAFLLLPYEEDKEKC